MTISTWIPVDVDEQVAWLHTLYMECGQTMTRLLDHDGTDEYEPQRTGFGLPGRDYSEEYPVTAEPLYRRKEAPDAAVTALRQIATMQDGEQAWWARDIANAALAQVGTHPQGGDSLEAPAPLSDAVAEGHAPPPQPEGNHP